MTAHPVTLKVSANVPKDCSFWPEDDSWKGVCEELSLTVRGSSFEDAKRNMYSALLLSLVFHQDKFRVGIKGDRNASIDFNTYAPGSFVIPA